MSLLIYFKKSLVRGWIIICITGLFLAGCTLTDSHPENDPGAVNAEAKLKTLLQERKMKASLLPLHDSVLQKLLPLSVDKINTFKDTGSTFLIKDVAFSKSVRTFSGPENTFLTITLSDYVADPDGFLNLRQQFLHSKEPNHPDRHRADIQLISPGIKAFAWSWKNSQTQTYILEAGLYYRFHLLIQTNLPDAGSVCKHVFDEIENHPSMKVYRQ